MSQISKKTALMLLGLYYRYIDLFSFLKLVGGIVDVCIL